MKRRGISAGVLEGVEGPESGFFAVIVGRTGQVRWHSDAAFPDPAAAFAAAAEKKKSLAESPKPSRGKK